MAKATQWPARIVMHHCPVHGFVEQDFLDRLDEADPDLCPVPTYDETACGERLDAGTVEYVEAERDRGELLAGLRFALNALDKHATYECEPIEDTYLNEARGYLVDALPDEN